MRAHSYSLDLTDELSISAAVNDAVSDLGALTTLVHAAGPHVPMTHLSRVTSPAFFTEQLTNQEAEGGGGGLGGRHSSHSSTPPCLRCVHLRVRW